MTENQKTNEITIITQQLATLKEQISKANIETKPQFEKRDKLNEQFKKLRMETQELRNERNKLNEKVQSLKQQRDENRAKIKTIIEELKTHTQKISELKKKKPKQRHRDLQKELDDIEWKIQTTSLEMQEEKRLIENVKQLETKLAIYRKINRQIHEVSELRKELVTLEANADNTHQELTETAKKSQELHTKMMAKINESKTIKDEADSLHRAYVQAKEQIQLLYEEVKKLTGEKKRLQDIIQEEDKKRKKTEEQALKEKLESQARDKLQRGEKLSWNEFQLLSDDDSQDP